MSTKTLNKGYQNKGILAIVLLAVVTIITFGFIFRGDKLKSSVIGTIDTDTYQAIELDNGKTYYGKITDIKEEFITLTDIFYFLDESNQKLVKRSKESDEEVDSLMINSAHILSAENLDGENAVLQAIQSYKNKN